MTTITIDFTTKPYLPNPSSITVVPVSSSVTFDITVIVPRDCQTPPELMGMPAEITAPAPQPALPRMDGAKVYQYVFTVPRGFGSGCYRYTYSINTSTPDVEGTPKTSSGNIDVSGGT